MRAASFDELYEQCYLPCRELTSFLESIRSRDFVLSMTSSWSSEKVALLGNISKTFRENFHKQVAWDLFAPLLEKLQNRNG